MESTYGGNKKKEKTRRREKENKKKFVRLQPETRTLALHAFPAFQFNT